MIELDDPRLPSDSYDPRWICWKCGDLALLSSDGLCRKCRPERVRVAGLSKVAARAVHGETEKLESRWRIC